MESKCPVHTDFTTPIITGYRVQCARSSAKVKKSPNADDEKSNLRISMCSILLKADRTRLQSDYATMEHSKALLPATIAMILKSQRPDESSDWVFDGQPYAKVSRF